MAKDENLFDKTQGFVLLWRSIRDRAIWGNPKLLKTYLYCLMRANFEPVDSYKGLKNLQLKAGQFAMSYPHAAQDLGLALGTTYNYFQILETERFIERKPSSTYTVVTIRNWESDQTVERKTEHEMKAKRKQNETENTLNKKNLQNLSSAKDNTSGAGLPPLTPEKFMKLANSPLLTIKPYDKN